MRNGCNPFSPRAVGKKGTKKGESNRKTDREERGESVVLAGTLYQGEGRRDSEKKREGKWGVYNRKGLTRASEKI